MIAFVMVDANCTEVAGLAGALTIEVSKAGAAFAGSAGAQGEIGSGWYHYTLTAAETNTVGPIAIRVNGAGAVQQNVLFFVHTACVGCTPRTYTVVDAGTGLPIQGVTVEIAVDVAGAYRFWCGTTDVLGVARDINAELPCLLPGTYFMFRSLAGWVFENPDEEIYV